MCEERVSAQLELPQRKRNRLTGRDYSGDGAYFITFCVKGRYPSLGEIDEIHVGDGVPDVPSVRLSDCGKYVERHIAGINKAYGSVSIVKYMIMPNHVHMIVRIHETSGTSRTPSPTNETIPRLVSTLKRFVNRDVGENIWQRSYHDHIIRGEADYRKIWEYIHTNPAQWKDDCFFEPPETHGTQENRTTN